MRGSSVTYVPKKWGFERWVANSDLYCGKVLFLAKGVPSSLHFHRVKDETMYVQEGAVILEYVEQCFNIANRNAWLDISVDMCPYRRAYSDLESELSAWKDWLSQWRLTQRTLLASESFHVPPGLPHRFTGLLDSYVFEVSTKHDDNDVVRIIPA
jgi:D-lyxose ketol-isomerase